jgi:hypothetical protein
MECELSRERGNIRPKSESDHLPVLQITCLPDMENQRHRNEAKRKSNDSSSHKMKTKKSFVSFRNVGQPIGRYLPPPLVKT